MMRWLFLMLLLANALLFLWYAQQQVEPAPEHTSEHSEIRLLKELPVDAVLPARERICLSYQPLADRYDAERLATLLKDEPVSAEVAPLPPAVIGYRLTLPLPATADARIQLLDRLAEGGWVPETRGGALSFGTFNDREALERVRGELPRPLQVQTRVQPVEAQDGTWEVRVKHLSGYKISSEIKQVIENGWPEIKVKKNAC
ncbi:hypothetical protein [Marinobacterium litorale]|uniref:hypothetical protein n=1 Tax=Marinobacterium litorale TaxID=404770 RepID=UPI0004273D18|nr:hypothetical protein [Marinobacterium litorale]